METSLSGISQSAATTSPVLQTPRLLPRDMRIEQSTDKVDFGKSALSTSQSMNIVMERAMEKLRSVVTEAQSALGISDTSQLDTSPEATANRIADFALGAYSKWRERHSDLSDEDARTQFASVIGGAVQQGIGEARGILSALNAMSGEVDTNINKTWEVVQQRLSDFVGGK